MQYDIDLSPFSDEELLALRVEALVKAVQVLKFFYADLDLALEMITRKENGMPVSASRRRAILEQMAPGPIPFNTLEASPEKDRQTAVVLERQEAIRLASTLASTTVSAFGPRLYNSLQLAERIERKLQGLNSHPAPELNHSPS